MNKKKIYLVMVLGLLLIPATTAQLENIGGGGSLDFNNLLSIAYGILGPVGQLISIVLEVVFGLSIVIFLYYWLIHRQRTLYNIPVRMYEVVQGNVVFAKELRAGFILNSAGGGSTFRLMPTLRQWKQPALIKPQLNQFQTTLKGSRYINYVRLGKDARIPFTFEWNLEDKAVVRMAQELDLDSIKNELTANYIKFREDGWWQKYGNQAIIIGFALVLGFFLFIVAKEFTRTADIVAGGNRALAESIANLGKQIVQ